MSVSPEVKPKKKVSPQIWRFYDLKGVSITRLRKECPRCGRGTFLAEHADRQSCGKCGYTVYKKK